MRSHPSKPSLLVASAVLMAACRKEPVVDSRTITLHASAACGVPAASFGVLYAFGDFQASVDQPPQEALNPFAGVGRSLAKLPRESQFFIADVASEQNDWRGVRSIARSSFSADIDILLWPSLMPCAMTGDIGARTLRDAKIARIDDATALVAGGLPNAVSYTVHLGTGDVTPLPLGLPRGRVGFSVTPFEKKALLAGGETEDGPVDAADIFQTTGPGRGDFVNAFVRLSGRRSDHAAALLSNGDVLLGGGSDSQRGIPNRRALRSLEQIPAGSERSITQGLAELDAARIQPIFVRLANGDILVVGGTDSNGANVGLIEWLSRDAKTHARTSRSLVARSHTTAVALPGGGALIVISSGGAAAEQNVWVVSANGAIESGEPIAEALADPRLFDGANGEPILWTGRRWMRWNAWRGGFTAVTDASGISDGAPAASADLGLVLWLEGDGLSNHVTGFRFDAQGSFGPGSPYPFFSAELGVDKTAPDRLIALRSDTPIQFDPTVGLSLAEGTSVFVTDLLFSNLKLDIDIPTGEPPSFVFRTESGEEWSLGDGLPPAACTFIFRASSSHLTLERLGARIELSDGSSSSRCNGPSAGSLVSIGLRGELGSSRSVVKDMRVVRLP